MVLLYHHIPLWFRAGHPARSFGVCRISPILILIGETCQYPKVVQSTPQSPKTFPRLRAAIN